MTPHRLPPHISRQFDEDLEGVRARVLAMGDLVDRQLNDALTALKDSDVALAEEVVANEIEVNTLEVSIDEECTQILARRQPAAGDLRLVVSVVKTITDLERVGDEAEKIARMAIELAGKQGRRGYYIGIVSLGNHVRNMVRGALEAFAGMDSRAALATARKELESGDQYAAIMRQLVTYMMEDPRSITSLIDAIWVARAMERIGDHARNICENVIYFVEGKDVRHISIEEMEQEVNAGG